MFANQGRFTPKLEKRKLALLGIFGSLLTAGAMLSGCAGLVSGNSTGGGTTPLSITSAAAANPTQQTAQVTWQTNIAATSQVQYGLTVSYGLATTADGTMVTAHQQMLASLKPNTTYHFRVTSTDAKNQSASSNDQTFTTTADTTPPVVSISSPVVGASLSGIVSVVANATDNVTVAGLQFKVDGANTGSSFTAAPYSYSLDTKTLSNGNHVLSATATDEAGNTTTSATVAVKVSNGVPDTTPPTASITAPASGGTVSGAVSVTATASDNVGVASVQFQLDGANVGTLETAGPYAFSWDTTKSANGSHALRAIAKDAAGNTGTSTAVTVTVNNSIPDTTPPSVPTSLVATAVSSSQIDLTWNASTDNVGVTGYNVYRAGAKIGTSAATSYSDAGLSASTSFSYMVAAFDAAGNVSGQSSSASATTLTGGSGNQIPSTLGWFQIPNTSIKSLCPNYPEIQGGSGCASIMSAWSGALFDTKRNRLVIKGGGHSDYYGNEIYAIDFNANPIAPVLVKDASHGSAISNVTSTPEAFNDGTPNARHTYNGWVYLPTQDSYLLYGAGLSTNGPFTDGQWLYNPSNSSWTQQQPSTHPNTAKTGSIPQHAYDPVTDKVYFVEGNAGTFWQLNPATGAWTNLGNSGAACGNDNATSSIDPVRRLYACVGNGELFTVSLNSPYTVTDDTSAAGCSTLASTNSPGFAYDPIQQLFVGWAGGNTVYTYNPSTHKCSANTAFSGGPTSIQPNGTFGRFRYAPALGVFVVANDINANVYSLRLTPVGGTSGGPNITGVTANSITTSSLTIAWTTDVASTSQVEYGTTTAYGTMTTLNSSLVTSHSVALTGLSAGTVYHYRVHSKNSGGVESISADSAVATNNTVDTTPPTVAVTSPAANATVSGTVNITANAADNQAVASVQFTVDGGNVGAASTSAPYTASWDTTTAANGAHTLGAVAKDASGNVGNAISVAVNVSNTGTTASNFQALCTAPGVVKCVTWDNASDVTPASGGGGYASGAYPAEDGTYQITQDTTSKVDGAGALKFNIRPGSQHPHGTNPAGYWLQQFGTDGSPQHFGEGTTLYLQFRFKVSASMLTYDWTQAGGEGWKVFIVWGPIPGQSCTSDQFVQENTNQTNIATGYVSCGTPGLYSNNGNPPMNLEQGDYNCAYAGSGATYTGPNCFVYPADTWITEYWVVHIGTFGQPNSNFQAWIASEGQPLKQFINLPNFNFGDGSDHTVGLNGIELTPYFSGANGSTTTPAASMWFDDLIISTQPIAAPNN